MAGKRYDGLVAGIWSSGIVLYAMLCDYLPFEDPNTKKLYKKIIKGSFILPDYLSEFAKDILKKILNTNSEKRYKIQDIRQHPWYNLSIPVIVNEGFFIGKTIIPIDSNILSSLSDYGIKPALAQKQIEDNRHNDITTTYYLLIARHKKESAPIVEEEKKNSGYRIVNTERGVIHSDLPKDIEGLGLHAKSDRKRVRSEAIIGNKFEKDLHGDDKFEVDAVEAAANYSIKRKKKYKFTDDGIPIEPFSVREEQEDKIFDSTIVRDTKNDGSWDPWLLSVEDQMKTIERDEALKEINSDLLLYHLSFLHFLFYISLHVGIYLAYIPVFHYMIPYYLFFCHCHVSLILSYLYLF